MKQHSSIREILEKYDNDNEANESLSNLNGTANFTSKLSQPQSLRTVPAKMPVREEIKMPDEAPMGCMQKLGRSLGMTSDIDPKKIYQIEIKIRNLQTELDQERSHRSTLEN